MLQLSKTAEPPQVPAQSCVHPCDIPVFPPTHVPQLSKKLTVSSVSSQSLPSFEYPEGKATEGPSTTNVPITCSPLASHNCKVED